ncbi:serine/threonine-protein kinase pim-3-like [Paramormyrops kingsleyae]|uniref:serine/threonine-protein kinase pim-3-like n=1 Tax=Paramormyrops kingsleyae TaxID=1676925 RepID=UPI003B96E14F
MEINKPSVSESRVRGKKRSRSPSEDEGHPVKRARRNLNSQGRIHPSTSSAKAEKGPFKVSESRVRGRKRSRSPSKDEGRPVKRGRRESPAAAQSGYSEAVAGSGTGGVPADISALRTKLLQEISQQLTLRKMEPTALDDAGHSVLSPKPTTFNSKERLEDFFSRGALIGSGGFGSVFAGIRKDDGLPVAIKEVRREEREEVDIPALGGKMPKEVALMKQLSIPPACPYIVKLDGWYDDRASHAIVMERPEPCLDLYHFCMERGGYMSEELAQLVLLQLVLALFHCEDRGVRHGDIKAQNLLIQTDSLQVKLIDFGCGGFLKGSLDPEYLGAAVNESRARFLRDFNSTYTTMAIGEMLFRLVCGSAPSCSQETESLRFPREVSEEFRDLMDWCLGEHHSNRPTLEHIACHPWLQKC